MFCKQGYIEGQAGSISISHVLLYAHVIILGDYFYVFG